MGIDWLNLHPAANHKIFFNYKRITSMFEQVGLQVSLLEFCDEKAGNFSN